MVIFAWNSYEYSGSTITVALVAAWLTALVLTFLRPGLAGAFAAVAPATLLSVRDDMPGTVILALLVVACAVGVFYRSGMAAQALSYGAILCAGPVIANTAGYYGEGSTFSPWPPRPAPSWPRSGIRAGSARADPLRSRPGVGEDGAGLSTPVAMPTALVEQLEEGDGGDRHAARCRRADAQAVEQEAHSGRRGGAGR
ncbi:hypothetical protein OIE69_03355 [Actinacidiphila glaucinigra]|uniref:hypothetical protein n=1 Tax=Actinacidiphila glaucinigra TaxID=235986 RepID=UPI002DDC8A62|nr:hypothetical protein [Actinacidiphila glaucinigra]WSD57999.1 hypothetical protein OIE69_03355 [Actinacidiphila glaucinigra]